jgi:hypothetical protein
VEEPSLGEIYWGVSNNALEQNKIMSGEIATEPGSRISSTSLIEDCSTSLPVGYNASYFEDDHPIRSQYDSTVVAADYDSSLLEDGNSPPSENDNTSTSEVVSRPLSENAYWDLEIQVFDRELIQNNKEEAIQVWGHETPPARQAFDILNRFEGVLDLNDIGWPNRVIRKVMISRLMNLILWKELEGAG